MFKKHLSIFFVLSIMMPSLEAMYPNTITGTVSGVSGAVQILIKPNGLQAYAVRELSAPIIIDIQTNTAIGTISDPHGLVPAGSFFNYLAISPDGTKGYQIITIPFVGQYIVAIDVPNNQFSSIVTNNSGYPFLGAAYIAFKDNSTAYIVDAGETFLYVLSTVNDTINSTAFDGLIPTRSSSLAISGDGNYGILYGGVTPQLIPIDFYTSTVGAGNPMESNSTAFAPNGSKVYNASDSGIEVLDPTTAAVTGMVSGGITSSTYVTFADNTTAYAISGSTVSIPIIDVATNTVSQLVADPMGLVSFANGLAITPNHSKGLVATINNVAIMTYVVPPPSSPSGCTTQQGNTIINTITWEPPIYGTPPSAYEIYRDANLYELIATIPSSAPLTYQDTEMPPYSNYTYYIVSLDSLGNKSAPVSITITERCTPLILPPSAISGCKTQNKFFTQTDFINKLSWVAPITGTIPTAYNIYRDAYLTDLVATIPSSSTLQYYDHRRNPNVTYTYYITSVDSSGSQSAAASVTVTNPC